MTLAKSSARYEQLINQVDLLSSKSPWNRAFQFINQFVCLAFNRTLSRQLIEFGKSHLVIFLIYFQFPCLPVWVTVKIPFFWNLSIFLAKKYFCFVIKIFLFKILPSSRNVSSSQQLCGFPHSLKPFDGIVVIVGQIDVTNFYAGHTNLINSSIYMIPSGYCERYLTMEQGKLLE